MCLLILKMLVWISVFLFSHCFPFFYYEIFAKKAKKGEIKKISKLNAQVSCEHANMKEYAHFRYKQYEKSKKYRK